MMNYHITPQFKTNVLFQTYRFQYNKERRAEIAMLARLFQYGIEQYPSKRELKKQLEMLYNVQFATGVERDGMDLILTFTLTFPEYRFVNDEAAFNQTITLFQQLIHAPYFMEATDFSVSFEQEKQHLIEQIKSVYDDKTQYAFTQLQTHLLKNTPYFEDVTGTEEMVAQTKLSDVQACWKFIQQTAQIEMYATLVKEETAKQIQAQFAHIEERLDVQETSVPLTKTDAFYYVENQKVTQAKINFAFVNHHAMEKEKHFINVIATAILGGGSQSKLFQNVREKHSLAYYANAISDSNSGVMYIYSGVNSDKIDEATTCIFEQIEAMKNGEVSDEELTLTKKVMINSIKESLNRPMGIIQFDRKLKKYQNISTKEQYFEQIESVTKESVAELAKHWHLQGQFILKGEI